MDDTKIALIMILIISMMLVMYFSFQFIEQTIDIQKSEREYKEWKAYGCDKSPITFKGNEATVNWSKVINCQYS